jgi:predicted GIY-YIG superfamily endonuclease
VVTVIALFVVCVAVGFMLAAASARIRRPSPRPVTPSPVTRPRRARRVRTDVPHLLYVYYWAAGGEAYWGISNEPERRHARHQTDPRDQEWMPYTDGVMHPVAWYPNRAAALAAERAAIRRACARGDRIANTVHNTRRRGRARTA